MINICYINKKIKRVIRPYIEVEVERLTNNIISNKLNEIVVDSNIYLNIDRNSNGVIEKVSYDTYEINKLKDNITKKIQEELLRINNGEVDDYFIPDRVKNSRFNKFKKGIICDISIDSIYDSIVFANVGPTIPIKIVFNEQLNSDIDINVKEYGINNVLVEMYLVVTVNEQIIMPMTSKRKKIIIREPLVVDIIQGEIPNYYNGYLK